MRIGSLDQQSWSHCKVTISVTNYPRKCFILSCADVIFLLRMTFLSEHLSLLKAKCLFFVYSSDWYFGDNTNFQSAMTGSATLVN